MGRRGRWGATNSLKSLSYLQSKGFPTVGRVVPGIGHTDTWIRNDAPASSLAVRQQMRDWIAGVVAGHPGTYSIVGTVRDAQGNPLAGVRIQSGDTHWTYTDADGKYELAGLINSNRVLTANCAGATASMNVAIRGSDVQGMDFTLAAGVSPLAAALPALRAPDAAAIDRALTELTQPRRTRSGPILPGLDPLVALWSATLPA